MKRLFAKIKSEDGSIMGMVFIFFIILTIVGTAFLTMASQESMLSAKQYHRTRAFYRAESGMNIALWRINHGADSYGTFSTDSVAVEFDTTTHILSAVGNSGSTSQTLQVELFQDHPFNRIVSYRTDLDTSSYYLDNMRGHDIETYYEVPQVDMPYFSSIADYYHTGDISFSGLMPAGIHYINGNVTMKNGTVLNGTLVVTGSIKFVGSVTINAQLIPDTTIFYPALVTGDTAHTSEVDGNPNLIINGAVYSSGVVDFKGQEISGPIIANKVILRSGVKIDDHGVDKYYHYPPGFITEDHFDWEKRRVKGSWRTEF
ncbi:MAG: pilus assembly PilX N-terminal domain-containing protein [Candidatus Marinimicrobia bacterium]|nr:pilus assembly PilX N-terminal domain-containing protein [Candidatus Neomarinimicrobiota bacterium]